MDSKISNINYNSLASRFISDEKLSLTIKENISFVEKYLVFIDESFDNPTERQIVYRELGSIVYSCIEAVLKSVLCEINNRCIKRKCNEDCDYRQYHSNDEINYAHNNDALTFLMNTRLLGLSPSQIDEFRKLNDLRNYIHISKNIANPVSSSCFDKTYVERLLFYYYEILDQLDLDDFYFTNEDACLLVLDQNDIAFTKKQNKGDLKAYYMVKLYDTINKILSNKELFEDDIWVLKTISNSKYFDKKEVVIFIGKEISYSRRYYKDEESFNKSKQLFLERLFAYINSKPLKEKLIHELDNINF